MISKDLYSFNLKFKDNYRLKGGEFIKFHEDIIFKMDGQQYGQEFIELLNIKGKTWSLSWKTK